MSFGHGSKWNTLKNNGGALRAPLDYQDDGHSRGFEPRRGDPPRPADPRPVPSHPAYEYYASDPGPQYGSLPWQNSRPLHEPVSPLYHQAQYLTGSNPQGYGTPSQHEPYRPSHLQAYGQHPGYSSPPPTISSPHHHHSGYQQHPMPLVDQAYQGGQDAYSHSYNQNPYQPPGHSHSPPLPLPLHPDRQGAPQDPHQSPQYAGSSYPAAAQSGGGPLSRTNTAPSYLQCEHRRPGEGLCQNCERSYGYSGGR